MIIIHHVKASSSSIWQKFAFVSRYSHYICWHLNGMEHRYSGPCLKMVYNNNKYYKRYGKLHRLDGPAQIIYSCKYYWINGKVYLTSEYKQKIAAMKNRKLSKLNIRNKAK